MRFNNINVQDFYAVNKLNQTPQEKQSIKRYLDNKDREDQFFFEMNEGFEGQQPVLGINPEMDIVNEGHEQLDIFGMPADEPLPPAPIIPEEQPQENRGAIGGQAEGAVGGARPKQKFETVRRQNPNDAFEQYVNKVREFELGKGAKPGGIQTRSRSNPASRESSPLGKRKQEEEMKKRARHKINRIEDYLPTVKDNPAHVIAGEDWKRFATYPEDTAIRLLADRANQIFKSDDPNKAQWTKDYFDQYKELRHTWQAPDIERPEDIRMEDALSSTLLFNESEITSRDRDLIQK